MLLDGLVVIQGIASQNHIKGWVKNGTNIESKTIQLFKKTQEIQAYIVASDCFIHFTNVFQSITLQVKK